MTKIDRWFLYNIKEIIDFEKGLNGKTLSSDLLIKAKQLGFSDAQLAKSCGVDEASVYNFRKEKKLTPNYKLVDTCGAEFEAYTPYYYSTYDGVIEAIPEV